MFTVKTTADKEDWN